MSYSTTLTPSLGTDPSRSLRALPKGDVFPIGALPRTEGKAKRVIRKTLD